MGAFGGGGWETLRGQLAGFEAIRGGVAQLGDAGMHGGLWGGVVVEHWGLWGATRGIGGNKGGGAGGKMSGWGSYGGQ